MKIHACAALVFSALIASPATAQSDPGELRLTVPVYKSNTAATKFSPFKTSAPFEVDVSLYDGQPGQDPPAPVLFFETLTVTPRTLEPSSPSEGLVNDVSTIAGAVAVVLGASPANRLPDDLFEHEVWFTTTVRTFKKNGEVSKVCGASPGQLLGCSGFTLGQQLAPRSVTLEGPAALSIAEGAAAGKVLVSDTSGHAAWGVLAETSIPDGVITGPKLAAGTIPGSAIASETIEGANITDNSITGDDVADGTLTGSDIASGSIYGNDIAGSTLSGSHIADGTLTGNDIASGSIDGSDIASSGLSGTHIADGTLTGSDIADGSISGSDIANGTITGIDITNDSLGSLQAYSFYYDQGSVDLSATYDVRFFADSDNNSLDEWFSWYRNGGLNPSMRLKETGDLYVDGAVWPWGLDVAEQYPTAVGQLEPGTVVALDLSRPQHVVPAERGLAEVVIGIVSTEPGLVLSDEGLGGLQPDLLAASEAAFLHGEQDLGVAFRQQWTAVQESRTDRAPVALAGRVPVRVDLSGGMIQAGDRLGLGASAGVAAKWLGVGPVVGVATEAWSGQGKTLVAVCHVEYEPDTTENLPVAGEPVRGAGSVPGGVTSWVVWQDGVRFDSQPLVTLYGDAGSRHWISERGDGYFVLTFAEPTMGPVDFGFEARL